MTKFPLIFFCVYVALCSTAAIEVSSKIDFDSDDASSLGSSSNNSDPVVIVVGSSNADTRKEENSRGFRSSRPRAGGFVNVRGPVKPIRSHSNCLSPQPARPKVIKNIYIVVNGKPGSAKPGSFQCRENVCETTLSTDVDERGNVIGEVRLTVVTSTEDTKVEDVPVIDGVRGTGYDNRKPTTFAFDGGRASPYPPFFDNNIPQAPVYPQDQAPRRLPRPQSAFYPRNFGPRKDFPSSRPWIPSRGSVDDKIGAPLSQTNPSEQ